LCLAEVGEDVLVAPACGARVRPFVEVTRMAAEVGHSVDGAAAAQYPAARQWNASIVEMSLGYRFVAPADGGIADRGRYRRGDPHQESLVGRTGLYQANTDGLIGRQPVREHASRAARTDDQVIETFSTVCSSRSLRSRHYLLRRGDGYIRESLKALNVIVALHHACCQADECQIALRVHPVQRTSGAVIAEGTGRGQRPEHVMAVRGAA